MNIISYRGPEMAGGLSATLTRIWNNDVQPGTYWWYLSGNKVEYLLQTKKGSTGIVSFSDDLITKHYRFCNEFLWPVLHDLPQCAILREDDLKAYEQFNDKLSWVLLKDGIQEFSFIQDYQLALLPKFLKRHLLSELSLFWHIPWPKYVKKEHVEVLAKIAAGILAADTIGFHTQEYVDNFVCFVQTYLPYISLNRKKIVAVPLGIDSSHWASLAALHNRLHLDLPIVQTPFVLSIDRVDYTKGVSQRLDAIDCFFKNNPQWCQKISFIQVAGKTRNNIAAFDNYWTECQIKTELLKAKWGNKSWQPLVWIKDSLPAFDLAGLYMKAAVMLINPIRDGLNLTAKEFIACQGLNPGALALSVNAGAFHELKDHALAIQPDDPEQIAATIVESLNLSRRDRLDRIIALKQKLKENTLTTWWERFTPSVIAKSDGKKYQYMPVSRNA